MHVSLRQLRVFEAVARHNSYTRAAEELHLSQPAVSMQVRQLEDEIGLSLFERLGKQVVLTEAGREVFHYSRAIGQSLREMEEVLESLKGVSRGSLRIAVASTVNYFAPRLMAIFQQRHSGIGLRLDVTNRESLVQMLDSNSVDLVLMGVPPRNVEVEAEAFMDNPLVVIAPPDHPLAGERAISLARLAEETFVMREEGSGTRQAMERFFSERGQTIRHGMQMTRNEAVKQAVRSGLGLSVVSLHTIELELETRRLVTLDVEGFPDRRQWYLVYRRGKRLSPAAGAFREFVLSEAARIALPTRVIQAV
ncbi:LysR family transcriptional regulator [Allochromatium vinosum]|uniref:Transcriptional regulator, LysR family n=1 Tax=Allochromatium vinosum (strain ATCC 17899 / DSM 180 / NBRC 103801 / NCIMB 10441 / D) TaxID=572477 RepID=D3RSZ0_ALLVD|nr:LysR family transcriptional regulator [Allochromatium vinosum]ADC62299.1 transcriptional regulator, LysR family [Allochromatium vinosum DSM 180]